MNNKQQAKTTHGLKEHHKLLVLLTILFSTVFIFTSCQEEEPKVWGTESTASLANGTTSATVQVNLNKNDQNKDLLRTILGAVSDVKKVEVIVKTDGKKISDSVLQPTLEDPGIWEVTIHDLPLGIELEFEANAYNENDEIIFTDTIIQTMSAVESDNAVGVEVVFEMQSVETEIQPENPKILSVTIPAGVEIGSIDTLISFQIEYSTTIEYRLEIDKGTLSTLEGVHDPTTDLEVHYNAPGTPGEDTISIWINGLEGTDTVGASFPINVVESSVPFTTDFKFGPVINKMEFIRGSNFLMVSVDTDPETGLTYKWTGTGALSKLKGATTNPVKIDPFFDNYSGEITVSVTDGNGLEAEMTRVISANDFPYVPYIVVKPTSNTDTDPVTATNTVTDTGTVTDTDTAMGDPLDIPPAGTVLDPGTGLLWQDNDEHIRMKWSQAEFFCEDVLDQGGYADWRLPTLAELEIAYQHRDIFTAYAKLGYWSSDKYTYKSTKDHSDDRSDKYQSSKGHSDKDHDEQSRYWNLRFKSGSKRVADAHDKNAVRCVLDW